jgi:hypothetical protein
VGRLLPLAIPLNEHLLIDVVRFKPVIPLSANSFRFAPKAVVREPDVSIGKIRSAFSASRWAS